VNSKHGAYLVKSNPQAAWERSFSLDFSLLASKIPFFGQRKPRVFTLSCNGGAGIACIMPPPTGHLVKVVQSI